MKNAKSIHPLAVNGEKSGKITFLLNDDSVHTLSSVINEMTGDRMTYFDNDAPTVGNSNSEVKTKFNTIRKQAKQIISCEGDF